MNLFVNYQMTKRRNSILFQLRQLKRTKKIYKFYTNENGQIQYKLSENSNKVTVTYVVKDKESRPTTMSVAELLEKFT